MLDRLLLQSPQSLPAALAAGVILILALVWLYQSQLRMLPAPWNWLVPGLRLAAVVVILGAILKPVVVRLRSPWEQGAVLLLIDRSRSMSVVDSHRSVARRVALADAVGALAAGTRPIVGADLQSRAQSLPPMVDAIAAARSEMEYAQLSGRGTDAADARQRDATAALVGTANGLRQDAADRGKPGRFVEACDDLMALFDKTQKSQPDWVTHLRQRVDAVVNASAEFQHASDSNLYQNNPGAQAAADQIAAQSRLALVDRAISDPVAGLIANLPPNTPVLAFSAEPGLPSIPLAATSTTQPAADGAESNLSGAIAAVRQKLSGQAVQAVVLFSDGRQVGGSSGAAPSLDVPLFTVGVADSFRRDIAIARFDVPQSVFIGETATARVELAAAGVHNQPVDVTLTAEGKSQTQHVVLSEGRTPLTFPIKADSPGIMHVSVALSGVPGDITAANDQSERRIKVLADKVAVAVIGGSAGWDYQYLRNALQRTPWIQCRDEIVRKDTAPLRMSADEILAEQVVILDDVDPSALNAEQWDAVGKLVGERGGGAIVIAGDDVPPARLGTQTVLADLLPWPVKQPPLWQTWSGESPGYRLVPPEIDVSDSVKLSNDPEENRRRWDQLPAIYRILPITLAKPNVRTLLVEAESGEPVLSEGRVGVGRALFFGANQTWRWRYKIGERDQDRFWLQLVREAGEAPYAYYEQTMALDIDNISPTPNQAIHIRARILDDQGRPARRDLVPAIRMESSGADVMTVPLHPATPGVESGRYTGDVPGLAKGDYQVRLMVGGQPTTLAAPLHVEVNYEAEMADVSGDDGNLRRLAEASGGEFLQLEQIQELPAKLSAASERRPQTIEYPLWDSPYLFLFVLGCLGGEWAMRKQFGLV
jgi:predicted pyridoxine 5'-phosphate oxidase superfamily flavin-nucleotide-binding protein